MSGLVFVDMDGVVLDTKGYQESNRNIALSSWNVLFQELGIYHEHEKLKQRYLSGEFPSYMEWTDEACKVLQKHGLTKDKYFDFIEKRPFVKGAKETVAELKKKKYKIALISGSFQELADKCKNDLGLDYAVGHCSLSFDKTGKLQKWKLIPCDFEGKVVYFRKIADEAGISHSKCIYVGDNVNDVPIFREIELAIAFNATKEEVKKEADVVIQDSDLRDILKYIE